MIIKEVGRGGSSRSWGPTGEDRGAVFTLLLLLVVVLLVVWFLLFSILLSYGYDNNDINIIIIILLLLLLSLLLLLLLLLLSLLSYVYSCAGFAVVSTTYVSNQRFDKNTKHNNALCV